MNDILTLSINELNMLARKHHWNDFIQFNQSWANESTPLVVLTVPGVEPSPLQRWLEQNLPEQSFRWQALQSEAGLEVLLAPKLLVVFACDRLISATEMDAVAKVCGNRPHGSNAFLFAHPERLSDAAALDQLDKRIWNLFSDLQGNWKLVNLNEFSCFLWSGTEPVPEWLQSRLTRDTDALLDLLKRPIDESFNLYRALSLLAIAEQRLAASDAADQVSASQDVERLIQSLAGAKRHLAEWLQEDAKLQEQRVQVWFDQLEGRLQRILEHNLAGPSINASSLTTELRQAVRDWEQQALIPFRQWPSQRQEQTLQSLKGIDWRRIHELVGEVFYPDQLIAIFKRENPLIVDYLHLDHLPQQHPILLDSMLLAEPLLLGLGTAMTTAIVTSLAGVPPLAVALAGLAAGAGMSVYRDQQRRSQMMQDVTAKMHQAIQDEYRKFSRVIQNYAAKTESSLRETLDQLAAKLSKVASSPSSYHECNDYQRVTELQQMLMNQMQGLPQK
ncbi:hypothetical protein HJG54_29845 [Leptolyngbya sp. NK1-12]|uniref:Uncharacterized protein n=1 Tax=Leptolyngbya sp. NK1-12 TaxID=2547451 RepID=A0AA96WQG8_9CYAN|nr:hypothetical protein [Leptolyngbya sp. NK1-12]WNZ27116.1 hypothetical protein HJG54_29845 [Leptolyngbya sp. NK1-12]